MRKYPWRIGAIMAAYYGMNGVYQNFITVYFGAQGLSDVQISLLMALVPAVALVAQPFWGVVADRMRVKNTLLRLLYLCAAACMLALTLDTSFAFLLIAMLAYAVFYTPLSPLTDDIALEALGDKPFGPVRLMGTLAFSAVVAGAGVLAGLEIRFVIWATAALMLAAVALSFAVPNVPGHRARGQKVSIAKVLRERELLLLLAFFTILQITMGFFYTFYPLHLFDLSGGRTDLLGVSFTISSLSELPYLLLSDKLHKKYGAGNMLLVSCGALTLRWLLLGVLQNPYAVMATQALHSLGFIVLTVSMAHYIFDHVPAELRATGQMALGVLGFGVARIVGNLGGGALISLIGRQGAFLFNAGLCAASGAAFVMIRRRMARA